MTINVLTSGGWIKQRDLSELNTNGKKIRVYRKPEHHLEAAIEALKQAHIQKGREISGLKNLETEIQNKLYLIREGEVIRFIPIFFSRVQRYPSGSATDNPLTCFFNSWFTDLEHIYFLIQCCDPETQQKLFFYLAHRYHYNAPFSHKENVRLGYQTSPLAITDRNSYLRSSQTIWMQLASELVYQGLNTNEKDTSIVWIDHPNFVTFLSQFYQVVEISLLTQDTFKASFDQWSERYKETVGKAPLQPFYIFLKDLGGDPLVRLKKAQKFADKILKEMTEKLIEIENNQNLNDYFNQTILPETLRQVAHQILLKGGIGKNSGQYHTEEAQAFLEKHFREQLSEKNQKLCDSIQISHRNGNWDKEQIQLLFVLYKKHPSHFQHTYEFKKPADMKDFLKEQSTSKAFIDEALSLLSAADFLKWEDYIKAFQDDVLKNIPKSQINAKDAVGIFYEDSFEGLSALISPHRGEGMHNLVTVLGNLGYSPDAVRFLRSLLRGYPSFIPVGNQNSFLEAAMTTKILCLPAAEKLKLIASSALEHLNTLNSQSSLPFETSYAGLVCALQCLKEQAQTNNKSCLTLYSRFLSDLLNPILEGPKYHFNEATFFAIKKMTDSIKMALKHKDEVHFFIRDIQDVTEAWMLYIDINPLIENPVEVFQDALPSKPTVVHFTPYAMRSFTRVLQALMPANPNSEMERLRIQVFNQSYFELITNMERFQESGDVIISQSDAQLENCDVYFIDIHPNNAVETRLFSHDISKIIETLKNFPKNRCRTLVVDITLSSLSASEIKDLLSKADPLTQSGQLNLVLVQSLTKFSQIGLDKLSAGFLAVYNNTNQFIWRDFNEQLNAYQNQEPVDPLTLQFFACLTSYTPDLQKNYIEQINQNTKDLYHMVLQCYQKLNLPINKQILALTCNTDLQTCYLAFNSRDIFSHLDPSFNLSIEEINQFTGGIIEGLFIRLAEWLDLPLTERMSIGFPLSSINECMHAIRLTVGLEQELLPKYADIITYICFILNREYDPQFFFQRTQEKGKWTFPKRDEYFEEKVNIFKAMYPVDGKQANSVRINEPVPQQANARREFVLNNGTIQVTYHTIQGSQTLMENQLRFDFHSERRPHRTTYARSLVDASFFSKCLLASCLTNRKRENDFTKNAHTINLTAENGIINRQFAVNYLYFEGFFYIRKDNSAWLRFGDYLLQYENKQYKLSFNFIEGKLYLMLDGKLYKENAIFIQKGNERLPVHLLDIEEKWTLFNDAPYENTVESDFIGYCHKPDPEDPTKMALEPFLSYPDLPAITKPNIDMLSFMNNNTTHFLEIHDKPALCVVIERDQLAFELDGMSLYCRKETKQTGRLEIDFWGIKNPIHVRFLCLFFCYVALYKKDIPFEFVSESYAKVTLLEKNYDPQILQQVAKKILDRRKEILFLFDRKCLTQNETPVKTNPDEHHRKISQFCIQNSMIPYPNFMEKVAFSLDEQRG